MEIVKAKMSKELYFSLPQDVRDQIDIRDVVPEEYDYSDNELWQIAKKESTKAYKKLKEIEFNIRFNK